MLSQIEPVLDAASQLGPLAVILTVFLIGVLTFLVTSLSKKDKLLKEERDYSRARDKEDAATLNDVVSIMRIMSSDVKEIPETVIKEVRLVEGRLSEKIKDSNKV